MEITLTALEKGITGLTVVSLGLEEILQNIYEGKVPDQWLKSIYNYTNNY